MYVVRRPFRNRGTVLTPGMVVEPTAVKFFKSRIGDGHIVDVTTAEFDKWNEYFTIKYGTPIIVPKATKPATTDVAPSSNPAHAVSLAAVKPVAKPAVAKAVK